MDRLQQKKTSQSDYVVLARVGRAKGLKGEAFISLYNQDSDLIFDLEEIHIEVSPNEYEVCILEDVKVQGNKILIKLENVDRREDIEVFRGKDLCILRSQLPQVEEGEFYFEDLKGLTVIDEKRGLLGEVESVMPSPSNAILCVGKGTSEILIPFLAEVIQSVDLEKGEIRVCLMEEEHAF